MRAPEYKNALPRRTLVAALRAPECKPPAQGKHTFKVVTQRRENRYYQRLIFHGDTFHVR